MQDEALILAIGQIGQGSADTTLDLYQIIDKAVTSLGHHPINPEDVYPLGIAIMLRALPDGDIDGPFSAFLCAGFLERINIDTNNARSVMKETYKEYQTCINLTYDLHFASCSINHWGFQNGYPDATRKVLIAMLNVYVAGLSLNNRDCVSKLLSIE